MSTPLKENASLYDRIVAREDSIAVVGLGYVGLPLAVAFAEKADCIGFDVNRQKIVRYLSGEDPTGEVGAEALRRSELFFTSDENDLAKARFFIVAVPTPINQDKTPDLSPLTSASELIGRRLRPGSVVVYESTVYPGVTESICAPILESASGLRCGTDFKIGYSPERINPGDRCNRLDTIVKVVSGMDEASLEDIARVYELIIRAGVHRVSSIKVAEACKVAENTQRDINIAFVNELAMAFDRMGIDTNEVIDAMNTKWNALGFRPGLVGGHCIGVDPYYYLYEAAKLGVQSQLVISGRNVNESMPSFIANAALQKMALAGKVLRDARVAILGVTFKENCGDIRNSKVIGILNGLRLYGVEPILVDPFAESAEVEREYGVRLSDAGALQDLDCIILAVAHQAFRALSPEALLAMYRPKGERILIDVKGIWKPRTMASHGFVHWRL